MSENETLYFFIHSSSHLICNSRCSFYNSAAQESCSLKSIFWRKKFGSEADASSVLGLIIKHNLGSWKSDWVISGLHLQTRQHACLGCRNGINLQLSGKTGACSSATHWPFMILFLCLQLLYCLTLLKKEKKNSACLQCEARLYFTMFLCNHTHTHTQTFWFCLLFNEIWHLHALWMEMPHNDDIVATTLNNHLTMRKRLWTVESTHFL